MRCIKLIKTFDEKVDMTYKDIMEYRELTEKIIGCAYRVYNNMGFGFLESVYENCLMIELKKEGLQAERQRAINVYYEDTLVGEFKADIIVEDAVILELKSVNQIAKAHEIQLINYLVATNMPIGLIVNFAENKVQVKRKLKELPNRESYPVNPVNPVQSLFIKEE